MRKILIGLILGVSLVIMANSMGHVVKVTLSDADGYTAAQREQMEALAESLK